MPVQYREIFKAEKKKKKKKKKLTLEFFGYFSYFRSLIKIPVHIRTDSNKYPQSMFWNKNKKNRYTPVNPSFTI